MTALGNEFDHFSSLPHRKTKIASEAVQSDYSIIMILLHYDKKNEFALNLVMDWRDLSVAIRCF